MKIADLKNRINPADFYGRELQHFSPRRVNGDWCDGGLCPFHNDRKAGSFRVNLKTGAFVCFACSAKGGDVLRFAELTWGRTFTEVLKILEREYT